MGSAQKYELPFKLNNPDLLHNLSFVHGEWKKSTSGKTFEVVDPGTGKAWTECPTNDASDVDEAVQSSQKCFEEYRKISPRQRAQMLFKWDSLIRENKEDIATILVYECPLAYVWLFEQGRRVAERCGVAMVIVECVASNAGLWKQRLEGRAAAALGPAAEGAAAAVRSPASDDSEAARRAWAGGIPRLCDLPAAAKWHNYVAWEGLAAKIESYGRCWEYDTGGAAKLVVDTTAGLPLESLLASVLNWLRQIQTPI